VVSHVVADNTILPEIYGEITKKELAVTEININFLK